METQLLMVAAAVELLAFTRSSAPELRVNRLNTKPEKDDGGVARSQNSLKVGDEEENDGRREREREQQQPQQQRGEGRGKRTPRRGGASVL